MREDALIQSVSVSLADRVYTELLEDISAGDWDVGQTVSAYALAKRLGVSRTPVVEALKRLEADGLIEIVPRVGARLLQSAPEAIDELLSIVTSLLGVATERAATRVDDEWLNRMEEMVRALATAGRGNDPKQFSQLSQVIHTSLTRAGLPRHARAAERLWRLMGAEARRHTRGAIDSSGVSALEGVIEALRTRSPQRARAAAERYVAIIGSGLRRSGWQPAEPTSVEALEHTALIYRSKPEFVASVLPHVLLGLQRGEPVLVVTCPDNLDALVSSVGAESSRVEFRDSTQWYDDPGSAFRRYRAYIDDHSASSRVRIIGEPPWLRRAAPEVEVWLRYESVINIALETRLGLILCPYNATELSAHLLAGARATHPHVYEKGQLIESEEFTPFFPTPT